MSTTVVIMAVLVLLFILIAIGRRRQNRGIVQYTAAEVAAKRKSGGPVLLDVRTDAERAAGSIPQSLHIPLHALAQRRDELNAHRDREIICFCRSGSRSMVAAAQLTRLGFTAASLQGGIMAWESRRV